MAYGRGLAEEIVSGRLDPAALERMPDEAALAELVRLKGIGRWTAAVYLLFALGRTDVWPAQDLALAVAAQRSTRMYARRDSKAVATLADAWRPGRCGADLLLGRSS